MATVEQMEKKRTKQVEEILAATNYLKAAFMEIATVKGEILEADDLPFEVLKAEIYGLKQQVAELSGQITELKTEIAGLKFTTVTSSPPTSRRTKK